MGIFASSHYLVGHGRISYPRGHKCCRREQTFISHLDAAHLIGRFDANDTCDTGQNGSRKGAGSFTDKDIVDLHLPGRGMVPDGAAGIDPYVMEAQPSPGIFSGNKVPEKNSGKLRVRVPWQGFWRDCLPLHGHRAVPAG